MKKEDIKNMSIEDIEELKLYIVKLKRAIEREDELYKTAIEKIKEFIKTGEKHEVTYSNTTYDIRRVVTEDYKSIDTTKAKAMIEDWEDTCWKITKGSDKVNVCPRKAGTR